MSTEKVVVLAAGKGVRMKSELPKVLVPVAGKPMIEYVLQAILDAGITDICVVTGYRGELVRQTAAEWRARLPEERKQAVTLRFATQERQLGTGHAVMAAAGLLKDEPGAVMVLAGDSPMIRSESLRNMFEEYNSIGNRARVLANVPLACLVGTAYKDNPFGMGRIVRDNDGVFQGIVEEKDATAEQRAIKEVNMSYYIFDVANLLDSLHELRADNAQKEYYITDVPGILLRNGKNVLAIPFLTPEETLGINTPEDLAAVEDAIRAEKRHA